MRKIYLFMMVSLDGFFEGLDHDLSWHNVDLQFERFANDQLQNTGSILFGRKTYEMMAGFWPTEKGDTSPITQKYMNSIPKFAISRTLKKADWINTTLINKNIKDEINKLKNEEGKEIAILGSNNLSVGLLKLGLIEEIRIMLNPVAIGKGTLLFQGLNKSIRFELISLRKFSSGNVLLIYNPPHSRIA